MKPYSPSDPPCPDCDGCGEINDEDGVHGWWHCSCRAGKAKASVYKHTLTGAKPVRVHMKTVLEMDVVGTFVPKQFRMATVDADDGTRHSADWCLVESIEVVS